MYKFDNKFKIGDEVHVIELFNDYTKIKCPACKSKKIITYANDSVKLDIKCPICNGTGILNYLDYSIRKTTIAEIKMESNSSGTHWVYVDNKRYTYLEEDMFKDYKSAKKQLNNYRKRRLDFVIKWYSKYLYKCEIDKEKEVK